MRPKLASLLLLVLVAFACACGGAPAADPVDDGADALGTAPSDADPFTFGAPQVTTRTHVWDTLVVQNERGFDGVLVFGRTAPDAAPDQLILLDRRTGAFTYLVSQDAQDDPSAVAAELQAAGEALGGADASQGVGMRDFVTPDNACFIKFASIAVLAVAAIVAVPFVIEGAVAAEAGIEAAATRIAEQGLRTVGAELLKAAWASGRFRTLLGFKILKDGLKAWLLFSDKGQQLTAPIRRQVKEVVHAKCSAPSTTDPGAITLVGP